MPALCVLCLECLNARRKGDTAISKVAPLSIRTHTCGLGRVPKLLSPLVTLRD